VCDSADRSKEGLRRGKIIFGVCIGGFKEEVGSGGVRAAATALIARTRRRTQPTPEGVSRNRDVATVKQRVVERIVDELRELLGERLHVAVLDHGGRAADVRTEQERTSRG